RTWVSGNDVAVRLLNIDKLKNQKRSKGKLAFLLTFFDFQPNLKLMNQEFTVAELAERVGGEISGDATTKIRRVADLESAQAGEIAFVEDEKFFESASNSEASCLIIPPNAQIEFARALIRGNQPKLAFAQIAQILHPYKWRTGWDKTAIVPQNSDVRASFIGAFVSIGEDTYIGESSQIYEGVKIGSNVSIGKCSVIHPNCVIYDNVSIGNDCIIHAGTTVGSDGFGYVRGPSGYVKFPQIGTVIIEDDVEIGANTCIDRGALGETRIGQGTKIDNLVQIAHNVFIGERVIIASQTGISGSTVIESDAVIGGQVGMGDHARVLSGAIIGSKAGILPGKIVRAGIWWGVPVQPLAEYKRQNAHLKALPRLRDEVTQLRQKLNELEKIIISHKSD
ncbi:MAG: UDP-3-O-(3-hydroxymyristoyl)glucosamine N-acyltransferase, partial [Pyrinomonadaceae bacterium]